MKTLGNLDPDIQEWVERVEYCKEHGFECNGWEEDFMDNVLDWLNKNRLPTRRQMTTIEKIEFLVENGRDEYFKEFPS